MAPETRKKLVMLLQQMVADSIHPNFQENPVTRSGCEALINQAIVEGLGAYVDRTFVGEHGRFYPDRRICIIIVWRQKEDGNFRLYAQDDDLGDYPVIVARMNELINQAGFGAR